ncbi:MAG: NADH-quinone oxidoreductase subunit J, partial [bacterium]
DYLMAAQLLIYVGGILVILIFAMMISEHFPLQQHELSVDKAVSGGLMSFLFFSVMSFVAWGTSWPTSDLPDYTSTTSEIGEALLTTYLFPFEIIAVLLLVALIAATMTRKDDTEPHPNIEYQEEREN